VICQKILKGRKESKKGCLDNDDDDRDDDDDGDDDDDDNDDGDDDDDNDDKLIWATLLQIS
jgi:hypothetical protein